MRASEFITEGSKRLDQDTIDLVKMSWDEGNKPTEIAKALGTTVDFVKNILTKYYSDRPNKVKNSPISQDIINQIKTAWDNGKKAIEIAADLGMNAGSVANILQNHYKDRLGRQLQAGRALNDDDRNSIVASFLNNKSANSIANDYGVVKHTITDILKTKLGVERYNDISNQRKASSGILVPKKITPGLLVKIKELYVTGMPLRDISTYFDNVVNRTAISMAIKRQPHYEELKAKRDERTRKINTGSVATTTIYRPGTIGNQRSKGPDSKHTWGVNRTRVRD
jgi:hypothetical protein